MRKKTETISATLRKGQITTPANLDWFKKRQLFMIRNRYQDKIVLSSGQTNGKDKFLGTVVYCSEPMNIGQQSEFLISDYVPTGGVIEVKLK